MLTQEDLQSIAALISASEDRMDAKRAVERAADKTELQGQMAGLQSQMAADKEEIKNHMNVVIESQVMPAIRQIADGVIQANDRLDRVESRLDALEATAAAHELYIIHRSTAQN